MQTVALFGNAGTKLLKGKGVKEAKKEVVKTAKDAKKVAKKVTAPARKMLGTGTERAGGAGYRQYTGDALWLPNTTRPAWLDGSLPGDRGFDPLGLSKPAEYLQVDVDELDQNAAVNKPGQIIGSFVPVADEVSAVPLAPYSEVFGLQRFRENELIHGRWAMLACLGGLVQEAVTGDSWVAAQTVVYEAPQYANVGLPFSIYNLAIANSVLMGGVELFRNSELDPERRCYPGGFFDPLKLASDDSARTDNLREAEIKHARLAMVGFLGYTVQAWYTGEGALGSLRKFGEGF
ncbi:Chlorophyll a-b binding protein CP29 [Chlorella vulgaris]